MIHTISIHHHAFEPAELTVAAGDSVVWHNADPVRHSARRDDNPAFDTRLISPNSDSTAMTFNQASGTTGYAYYCEPHPDMTGIILVQAAGAKVPSGVSTREG
jgi:plastocyanin